MNINHTSGFFLFLKYNIIINIGGNLDDLEKYVCQMSNRDVTDNLGNTKIITTLEGESEWLSNSGKNGDVLFAIIRKEDDELLGNCSLMQIDRINRKCTLGIFIGEEQNRNKGYGTEILKLLLKHSFDFQNMHSIDLKVFSFNKRAIKCYEINGFKIRIYCKKTCQIFSGMNNFF